MDRFGIVQLQARMAPDRPAVAYAGGVATYAMLRSAVLSVAARIDQLGLTVGDIVAIDVRNPFHHLALLLALDWRGLPSLSVQTGFNVAGSGVKIGAFLMDRYVSPSPDLRSALVEDDWFAGAPASARSIARAPDSLVRVAFSSGTTGLPKAIAVTSDDLRHRFEELMFGFSGGSTGGIRFLNMLGFSTIGGYLGCLYALMAGGLVSFASNPVEALQIVRLFQISETALAPMQLQALVDLQRKSYSATPTLRVLVVAGGWTSPALMAATAETLCNNVLVTYGSTEMGAITLAPASAVMGTDGAVGAVLPWAELEIVDRDGSPVPAGTMGEIRARTGAVLRYLTDTDETRQLYRDGWFYPGDAGLLREDGVLVLSGRSVDLINRGGVTIAPDPVEIALRERLGLIDVGVFGYRVPGGIEEIWAAVVAPDGFDADRARETMRPVLGDRTPDRIIQVAIIPRNAMSKVMRPKLKEAVLAELERLGG